MDLKALLGDAYKEGMTFEEIEAALKDVQPPEDPAGAAEITRLKTALSKANGEAAEYKKQLRGKQSEAEQVASARFQSAQYDGTNDVSVSLEVRDKNRIAVVAVGGAVLFIEFGTGVRYPDNHPEASVNGFTRGGYGHRLGRLPQGWRYDGDPGTNGQVIQKGKHAGQVHTYGNPANMSMYGTVRELEQKFAELARRCFA